MVYPSDLPDLLIAVFDIQNLLRPEEREEHVISRCRSTAHKRGAKDLAGAAVLSYRPLASVYSNAGL